MPRSLSAQGPNPAPSRNLAVVPATGYLIPPHVLGRSVDDPIEEQPGGRRVQKPRLGVKVPYRNLTSQIVTQDEIAQEILQRSIRRGHIADTTETPLSCSTSRIVKIEAPTAPPAGAPTAEDASTSPASSPTKDKVVFAMKLTQRLATRLTKEEGEEEEEDDPEVEEENDEDEEEGSLQDGEDQGEAEETKPTTALLPRTTNTRPLGRLDPALERELALKQLQELPSMKKPRRRRTDPGRAGLMLATSHASGPPPLPPGVAPSPLSSRKQAPKKRKSGGEVDMAIQAGTSKLAPLDGSTPARKRKAPAILTPSSTKKTKKTPPPGSTVVAAAAAVAAKKVVEKKAMVNGTPSKLTSPKGKANEAAPEEAEGAEEGGPGGAQNDAASEMSDASVKRRKSHMRELDMLLGDEGAVNMIYEAEHGQQQGEEKKKVPRRAASAKTRADLAVKARLVKNAVLRLSGAPSGSAAAAKPSPGAPQRNRRAANAGKGGASPPTSPSEPRSPPQQFFPPGGAEASRIIRRHSSDSEFSDTEETAPKRPESPQQLTIIPGPKKKGVPIFVKKGELRTYRGKKKPQDPARVKETNITLKAPLKTYTAQRRQPPQQQADNSANQTKAKISAALKTKLTDEMSRNFQQALQRGAAAAAAAAATKSPGSPPQSKRKQTLEVRSDEVEERGVLDDDPTLRSIEAQLAAVVGEPISHEPEDLFAPSTSAGGAMRASPSKSPGGSPGASPSAAAAAARQRQQFREINLRRHGNLTQIILTPVSTKMKNALNAAVLRELREVLLQLGKDDSCRVVLFSSTGSSFCQGLDVNCLLHAALDKRKKAANELALALREFLRTLAHFSKPIAAAVHGPAVGLGVTMLPYFDMVFASDKATFYTPYSQLGQVPEGAVALTMPSLLGAATASELLFCCRKLTASEAQRCGLVTRILWPDRFQEELIPTLRTIANQSAQAMEGSKSLMRETLRSRLDAALEAEGSLLVANWTSAECQAAFRALLDTEGVGLQRQRGENA